MSEKDSAETAILFIKEQLQDDDIIIAPTPEEWYYLRLHGIDPSHLDMERPYKRVFVLTLPSSGQYLDAIIAEFKLENINRDTIQQIQDFSGLKIFLLETY